MFGIKTKLTLSTLIFWHLKKVLALKKKEIIGYKLTFYKPLITTGFFFTITSRSLTPILVKMMAYPRKMKNFWGQQKVKHVTMIQKINKKIP